MNHLPHSGANLCHLNTLPWKSFCAHSLYFECQILNTCILERRLLKKFLFYLLRITYHINYNGVQQWAVVVMNWIIKTHTEKSQTPYCSLNHFSIINSNLFDWNSPLNVLNTLPMFQFPCTTLSFLQKLACPLGYTHFALSLLTHWFTKWICLYLICLSFISVLGYWLIG